MTARGKELNALRFLLHWFASDAVNMGGKLVLLIFVPWFLGSSYES